MVFSPRIVRFLVAALALAVTAAGSGPGLAQSSRYSSDWQNPNQTQGQAGAGQVQGLVDELNRLIDAAAQARAADPNFLSDLRDLARRFDWPWRNRVLFDDFADGDATANPAWTVSGAPATVDRFDGLRTQVAMAAPQAAPQPQQSAEPEDVAVQLLGQLLRQSSRSGESQPQAATPARETQSILTTSAATANQFALQADIVFADAANGYIELGVVQGTEALGYRVGIRPGANDAAVEILRVGSRGSGVVDSALVAAETWGAPAAGQPRSVLFTRDDVGDMKVSIDGTVVLTANDRAFRNGFDGFIVRNGGGDYVVKSIAGYSK